jgi:hypothetical protein
MQRKKWLKGLLALCLVLPAVGCAGGKGAAPRLFEDDTRYGTNTVEIAPGKRDVRVPQWDNKNIDVDGDGDREHLSGANSLNNPSVDLRSFATPNGADHTQGIYPHTYTANRIADLANSVDGVQHAYAIVAGQTLIMGINPRKGVRPEQREQIVQLVRQRVLVKAPEFRRVHITADRALARRVQNVAEEMRAGHSLSTFNDEVMELTRLIPPVSPNTMPAVPAR